MLPHHNNYCSGRFADWLEVMLLPECNGRCSWCVESGGYHPRRRAPVAELIDQIVHASETSIMLLGGEPLLYPHLAELLRGICVYKEVYITTNGAMLGLGFVEIAGLDKLWGMNVSVHHFDMAKNAEVVGLSLDESQLRDAFAALSDVSIRMNCNIIDGYIDTESRAREYITWARSLGANKVRFAELKNDTGAFVSLGEMFGHRYGLNENPFTEGCNRDVEIDGMPVSFRQMCGFQTECRPRPVDAVGIAHRVLYYNGQFYPGWQREKTMGKKREMKKRIKDLEKELEKLKAGAGAPSRNECLRNVIGARDGPEGWCLY